MPFIKIMLSAAANINKQQIMKEISRITGEETGKGESKVMVAITESDFIMRGEEAECAFIDIRGIGKIERDINDEISRKASAVITEFTSIPAENIYLNFTDFSRDNWGNRNGVSSK